MVARLRGAVHFLRIIVLVEDEVVDNTVVVDWKSCNESCPCKQLTIHYVNVRFGERLLKTREGSKDEDTLMS